METSPLEMLMKISPGARLNCFQMELIEAEITDIDAWKETLTFWFGNNYRAESVFKMIEYYKQVIDKRSQGRWQDVGRPDYQPEQYKCKTCFDFGKVTKPDPNGQYTFSTIEVPCECTVSH